MKRPHKCCHPECLAGCYGDGPSMCVACKNVMHKNRCVSQCPGGTFKVGSHPILNLIWPFNY